MARFALFRPIRCSCGAAPWAAMGHSSVQLLWGIPCACPGLSYGAAELRKGVGIRAGFRIRNGVGIGVGIGVTHSADGTAAPFPALPPPAMTQLTARCYTPAN